MMSPRPLVDAIGWERLGELAGKPIRLRFDMWNTELYSFFFRNE